MSTEQAEQPAAQPPSRQVRGLVAAAAEGAASGAQPPPSMGLFGMLAQVANMSAVTLICVMFYQQVGENSRMAREDREVFREAVGQLRRDSDRQWSAIKRLTESVERLAGVKERGP
jgi:hypothetical protein